MYKDHLFAARCRLETLISSRGIEPVPDELERLLAVRLARTWAGASGVLGFAILVLGLFFGGGYSAEILVGSWGLMGVVFWFGLMVHRRRTAAQVERMLHGSRVFDLLALLDAGGPRELLGRRARRMEHASLVLPVIAFSLLVPLTLHLVVGATLLDLNLAEFNYWVLLSLILVGHAHLTLLILSVVHVTRVRRELDIGLRCEGVAHGFWALVWTITASAIPGAIFLFVPPVLVGLTGLVFVPWMFLWVARRAQAERRLMARLFGDS